MSRPFEMKFLQNNDTANVIVFFNAKVNNVIKKNNKYETIVAFLIEIIFLHLTIIILAF